MIRIITFVASVVLVMVLVTAGTDWKGSKRNGKREKFLKDKRQPVVRAECQPNEFSCRNAYCIPNDEVCDTHHNCPYADDETNCPQNCTGPHQFKCEKGDKCIGLIDKCDGYKDCPDYSDEAYCESFECPAGRFKCETSNECIATNKVCDSYKDCEDNSDERNCVHGSCSTTQFKCADGSKCIPQDYVCDEVTDCNDISDENNCSCSSQDYKCPNGLCIPNIYICDGENDCGDYSDESSCPTEPPSVCHDVFTYEDCRRVNETTHPICLVPDDANKFCREFCGICHKNSD